MKAALLVLLMAAKPLWLPILMIFALFLGSCGLEKAYRTQPEKAKHERY